MTKEQILKLVKKEKIKFINLQFVDILGMVKSVTIPETKLEEAIASNIWFDGSSVEGFTRISESDMYLSLDLSTFVIIPWEKREDGSNTARCICDIYMPDGKPFEGSPRYILKKVLKEAEKLGYNYFVGPELEFFLFKKNGDGKEISPLPHDHAGYFDLTTDLAQKIRQDMTSAMQTLSIDVEALHHEVAEGQHEIDFKYGNALSVADHVITFKYTAKAIAGQYDLHASFMPKPIHGINGSGMHIHQSLFRNNKNAFFKKNDPYNFSDTAKYFIAGQLKHIKEFCAILSPTVNSYKRLVPGYEAPVYIAWGARNRSVLIRVPRYTPGRETAVRCEIRCPDPSANPYIAFAIMLAAGLDGIKKKINPPDPIEENIYEYDREKARKKGIEVLPDSLGNALKQMSKSRLVAQVFGKHMFKHYIATKSKEWEEYKLYVSKWELDRYLEIY